LDAGPTEVTDRLKEHVRTQYSYSRVAEMCEAVYTRLQNPEEA